MLQESAASCGATPAPKLQSHQYPELQLTDSDDAQVAISFFATRVGIPTNKTAAAAQGFLRKMVDPGTL